MARPSDDVMLRPEDTVVIRQIQGLTALLSCLPAGGKAKELFGLALALDEGPWLEKIGPPADPDSDEGMKTWLESLWAQGDISPEEQEIVDWQSDSDNMTAAIFEFKDISAKLSAA
jgi:DurN substrate-assisted peptide maturase